MINARATDQVLFIKPLCAKAKVSESSTRKGFQSLVKAKILVAISGPKGGYKLAQEPKKISLLSIIKAVDGHDVFDHCVMGLPECGTDNPCPIHNTWKNVKIKIVQQMDKKNLLQFMQQPS